MTGPVVPPRSSDAIEAALYACARGPAKVCIVEAPPGSGKTRLLTRIASRLPAEDHLRVAVSCQTNSQADDVCRRLAALGTAAPVVRFASSSGGTPNVPDSVSVVHSSGDVPGGVAVVVGTTAKWGLVDIPETFDLLLIDEAWQLAHKDFQLLTQVAPRFVFIGDPGQIPPVDAAPSERWAVVPQAPHRPAPQILRDLMGADHAGFRLPATWRLPSDTAALVRGFYDFEFDAVAPPGSRSVRVGGQANDGVDRALDRLADATLIALTLPTPDGGPPLESDRELAGLCSTVVQRVLTRKGTFFDGSERMVLGPEEIGIAATHRRMVTAIELALPAELRNRIRVDTPERWQGLERPLLLAVHPLSGVTRPTDFDLETGRLCVMASRHKGGVILVARDHIERTLEDTVPSARQPVGLDDVAGRGHAQHLRLWSALLRDSRVHSA